LIDESSVKIRPYLEETDKNFLYSTWLKKYKFTSYFAKRIRMPIYYKGQEKIIDHILRKPTTRVLMACLKDDPNSLFGYIAYEPMTDEVPSAVIHFIFVKDIFQKMGVGGLLFKESGLGLDGTRFTHWTFPLDELFQKYPDLIYDPYAL
jgi:hypothetical protein